MSKDIEEIARAIHRTEGDSDDWRYYIPSAQAAYSVMEKRLGELEEALFVIADGEGEAQVIARQTLDAAGLPTPREGR